MSSHDSNSGTAPQHPSRGVDAVVCSPPYAGSNVGNDDAEGEMRRICAKVGTGRIGREHERVALKGPCPAMQAVSKGYGTTEGNVGNLSGSFPYPEADMADVEWHSGLYSTDGADFVSHILGHKGTDQLHEPLLATGADPETPGPLPAIQSPRANKSRNTGNVRRHKGNSANADSASLATTSIVHDPKGEAARSQSLLNECPQDFLAVWISDFAELSQIGMADGMEAMSFVGPAVASIETPMNTDRSGERDEQSVFVVQICPLFVAVGTLQVSVSVTVFEQTSVAEDRPDNQLLLLVREVGKLSRIKKTRVIGPSVMLVAIGRLASWTAIGGPMGPSLVGGAHDDFPASPTWDGSDVALASAGAILGLVESGGLNLEQTTTALTDDGNHAISITSSMNLAKVKNPMNQEGGRVRECETLDWPLSQCYGEGWGDMIVREAFAHP